LGGDFGANNDLPMGEGENIGGGGVVEMAVVQPAAGAGRHEHDAEFPG